MKVKFRKLHKNAVIPIQTEGNAGMDMTCIDFKHEDSYIEFDTGIAVEIPDGYAGYLFPRSSNSKFDLLLCNSVGIVDSSYRGSIRFRYKAVTHDNIYSNIVPEYYTIGDKIGQLVIMPYPKIESIEADELSETKRGDRGFGSSGR